MKSKLVRLGAAAGVVLAVACSEAGVPVEQPQPIPGETPFEYPVSMWDERVQGETMLLVHVTAGGDVDSARVYVSSGHEALDSAALDGARKLRFSPARQGDRRVPMWTKLPVRFSVDSATARISAGGDR